MNKTWLTVDHTLSPPGEQLVLTPLTLPFPEMGQNPKKVANTELSSHGWGRKPGGSLSLGRVGQAILTMGPFSGGFGVPPALLSYVASSPVGWVGIYYSG